jgi:hypothetical protein
MMNKELIALHPFWVGRFFIDSKKKEQTMSINNLKDVSKATSRVSTETAVGQEHITIQEFIERGKKVVGWERIATCGFGSFILYLA